MNVQLSTKRKWSWKVFLLMALLVLPASYAIIPMSQLVTNLQLETPVWMTWQQVLILGLEQYGMDLLYLVIGLLIANRIGLGAPFIEARAKGQPAPRRFRPIVALALLVGVFFAGIAIYLDLFVFGPRIAVIMQQLGLPPIKQPVIPPLTGLLGAFSAGIREEIQFRMLGLSLLALLGSLLFHDKEGRPRLAVLWIANLVFAALFGYFHMAVNASIGMPVSEPVVFLRVITLNAIGGLVFGWLYWTYGLESAMLAHFFGDVVIYVVFPVFTNPSNLPVIAAILLVVLALGWAARTLMDESKHRRQLAPEGA